jgi:hypothetical protein
VVIKAAAETDLKLNGNHFASCADALFHLWADWRVINNINISNTAKIGQSVRLGRIVFNNPLNLFRLNILIAS